MEYLGLYTAILAVWGCFLGARVGIARGKFKVSLGDGGNKELLVLMRGFGNFAEWVPLALIIMWLTALTQQAPDWALHAMGIGLVVGRLVHPFGLDADKGNHPLRGLGTALTFLVILAGAVFLLLATFS